MRVFILCLKVGKLLPIGGILRLCSLERKISLTHCLWNSMESLLEASVRFGYSL